MEVFLFLFFTVFAGIILFAFFSVFKSVSGSIAEKKYNDSQPILTKDVKVTGKRSAVSGGGETSVSNSYYATFEFAEDKKRLELEVEDKIYGLMAEGDSGKLTYQGRRFLNFERKAI